MCWTKHDPVQSLTRDKLSLTILAMQSGINAYNLRGIYKATGCKVSSQTLSWLSSTGRAMVPVEWR
jgi:hypothetical protein